MSVKPEDRVSADCYRSGSGRSIKVSSVFGRWMRLAAEWIDDGLASPHLGFSRPNVYSIGVTPGVPTSYESAENKPLEPDPDSAG